MRRFKRAIAKVLLLCIVGGVLSPSLDVYAAGSVTMKPAKGTDSTIVWSDDDDVVGSITTGNVTYPFWNNELSTPAALKSSIQDLGAGYEPTGDPNTYAEVIKNNHQDNSELGSSVGSINNYVYRFATTAYGLTRIPGYVQSIRANHPVPDIWAGDYDLAASYHFVVGSEDWTLNDTTFYDMIEDADNSVAWNAIGMDDKDTYLSCMGEKMLGGNITSLTKAESTSQVGDDSFVALETYGAMHNLIFEFYVYATKYRSEIYAGDAEDAPYKIDASAAQTLATLEQIYKFYDEYFPILGLLWSYKPQGEMSLEEMNEVAEGEYSPDGATIQLDSTFDKVLDESTPLGLFYIINSENGIARINREDVWNNIETDVSSGQTVFDYIEDMNGVLDGVNKWNAENSELREGVLSGGSLILDPLITTEPGVDQEGTAINAQAVSMSDYITQGMIYSSTFVPMKTNLYSPDTLAQFDQTFREEFYYKYGFMRKALMWDKSGTSVMDYYNANGKCTGTLSVITLRDLLESNGNDIALYVDGDFYNAAEAIEEGNEMLELRNLRNSGLAADITEYVTALELSQELLKEDEIKLSGILSALSPAITVMDVIVSYFKSDEDGNVSVDDVQQALNKVTKKLKNEYNFDMTTIDNNEALEFAEELLNGVKQSDMATLDNHVLKTGDYSQYSNKTEALLKLCDEFTYRKIDETEPVNNDNRDTIVLPSSTITSYMDAVSSYENRIKKEDEGIIVVNRYTSYDDYTPMLSLSYVSALYREGNYYSLANLVAADNPVFLASDDLCGVEGAGQWYCNTLLNYAFVQNLKSATQIDYTYTVDLDCPLYIDVFGNILTESGIVVIPAACNATLHTASYKNANVAVGLYSIYGKDYYVPVECEGAAKALFPFFTLDKEEGVYIINGNAVTIGTDSVQYNTLSPYDVSTQNAVVAAYESYIKDGKYTNLNWIAMTNIANEVMRGAPIENIDKSAEGLNVTVERNKAAIVAAVKLESLIKSFKGMMQNTMLAIPDFTRMDSTEYLIAFLIKMLIVATTAVVIIGVYRDGVSGTLGLRTLWKSLSSIALTFMAVCVIPAVFQLTYYAANKFLLQDEAMRILLLNTEKYQSGVEIGMLETYTPENDNDMAVQLDWISVPWYDQLENMLYGSTLQNLDEVKKKAYLQSPIFDNYDVELHDDGVYVTTESLFNGVSIDYTFNDLTASAEDQQDGAKVNGMYLYSSNKLQTAGFYSPYYVFLTSLVGNINEYNYYHDSYNYTTKYMSGNRLKTVGLCNAYFTSKSFMELDWDIMHIYEIYNSPKVNTYDHGYLFTPADKTQFEQSFWYNQIDEEHLDKRVELLNAYARDFVANNKDLLMKVSDETFIKVMALNMAIKYNQLFGIPSANAVEIYNMDSNDLLRLSIVPTDEAILASPMSYSRYVYNFGGEPAVYAAAVLTVIMWVGSFIKPLCTVIVFISVFLSIWVFRVVLRKPSANLLGYLITVLLLCATNILHAVVLKISTYLPNMGLSTLGCLLFIIVGQVVYLLLLGYVTGVSLKDWSNLGYAEYDREARRIRRKLGDKQLAQAELNGRIPYHEDNWEYYNDLVKQHRNRNA